MNTLCFRIVNIINNVEDGPDSVWKTVTNNRKNHILNLDCSKGAIPDEEIEKQVAFLKNQTVGSKSNLTMKSNVDVKPEVLRKSANILLFMSFCYEKPVGLQFLENLKISEDVKKNIIDEAVKEVHDLYFENEVFANMSKLEEENRFINWYHGYTRIRMPYWNSYGLKYNIYTSATTGNFKTQYFGDKYDPDKIERKLYHMMKIYPPAHVVKNPNYTLTLEIEKVNMKVSGDSRDYMSVDWNILDSDQNNVVLNFTAPDEYIYIELWRNVKSKEIETNINLETMPGFSIRWSYNEYVTPDEKYMNDVLHKEFKR